jgi:hypothetical protein
MIRHRDLRSEISLDTELDLESEQSRGKEISSIAAMSRKSRTLGSPKW